MARLATVSGASALGMFFLSYWLPKVIDGLPDMVQAAMIGIAAAFVVVPFVWWVLGKGDRSPSGPQFSNCTFNGYAPLKELLPEQVAGPPPRAIVKPDSAVHTPPATEPYLGGMTLQATAVLFPRGLYVGKIAVSAGRLENENTLELVINAFNGTGREIRYAHVNGSILAGRGNLRDHAELPRPLVRPEQASDVIEAYREFTFVLEQRVAPATAADFLEGFEADAVSLDLRSLDIVMEIADEPANRARLPLWDGVRLSRRDDVFTGRNTIMTPATVVNPAASEEG